MIKIIFSRHKKFLLVLFAIVCVAYVANLFIPKNMFFLAGEYVFSFDYLGHVRNILFDPRSVLAQDYTNCFDCPDFIEYSRWYSLFKLGYLSLSQILQLHPFIFLLVSMITTQITALYIFTRTFFKNFFLFPFLIASCIFILYPYKYSLFVETYDGFMYANVLFYLTVLLWSVKNLYSFSLKKSAVMGLVTGIAFSFFFNISIAYFPIVFYATLIVIGIYNKSVFKNIRNTIMYGVSACAIILCSNFPLFHSILVTGASRHYIGYLSYSITDSMLAGINLAQADTFVVYLFAALFIFCFWYAPLSFRKKIIMLSVYVVVAVFVLGMNSPIHIYSLLFKTLPFMDSLQATHRFLFFEFVIYFIVIYLTLSKLLLGGRWKKVLLCILSLLFVGLPIFHMLEHTNYFYIGLLPKEYFLAQKYLNTFSGEKVYFPPTTNLFHNIATDYTWSKNPGYNTSALLYKNPFTSLLPITNLIEFERFPYLLSPHFLELRYLTDLHNSPGDIVRAMELRGIRYVIVDKNYKWAANYPDFSIDAFTKRMTLTKQFGNIFIYTVKDLTSECKPAYGTISLNYCTVLKNPPKLINKTKEEYLLEVTPLKVGTVLETRHDSIYIKNILDPILHQSLVAHRVLFGKEIMQISGDQQRVFYSQPLKSGRYAIYIPMLTYIQKDYLMGQAQVHVYIQGKTIAIISPYANTTAIVWKKITFYAREHDQVTIDIDNTGYVIFASAPILQRI